MTTGKTKVLYNFFSTVCKPVIITYGLLLYITLSYIYLFKLILVSSTELNLACHGLF